MPNYEYVCRSCDTHLEVVQRFDDASLSECPTCSGALRKVFGSIGIAFKGSGFYKNDSRSVARSGKAKAGEGGGDGGKDSGEGGGTGGKDGGGTGSEGGAKEGAKVGDKGAKTKETAGAGAKSGDGSSSSSSRPSSTKPASPAAKSA